MNNNSGNHSVVFNIPEKLKINPNDSEEQRLLKRKRVKQLKNKQKQKEIEKLTQEKQQNWIDFNKKLKTTNYPHFRTLNTFKPKLK
jgi:methionine-rich copper-binding protein CopC